MQENKCRLKRFTFYETYWTLLCDCDNATAGRLIKNICKLMFRDEEIDEPMTDEEAFVWSSIEPVLQKTKARETVGKSLSYGRKIRHFSFDESFGKAVRLMTDKDSGIYIKAVCEYMFENAEPVKLCPPVDKYYAVAKERLNVSRVRKQNGSKGGKTERRTMTEKEIRSATDRGYDGEFTFTDFMKANPNVKNDLYCSKRKLLEKVDWIYLDAALSMSGRYKHCKSLTTILEHRKEIESSMF